MKPEGTSLTDHLGAQFGPYKLVRRLGVGGMAETFVAVRTGPGGFVQRVCLKLVLPFFRDNLEFIELFQREARLAAKLRHRNIVGVIDFGDYDGTSYMALELVDGLDLRTIIDSEPDSKLRADYVVLLGLELAEALEHAHHPPLDAGIEPNESHVQGIVHRDISPSNVLVSRQGEILLTDFGVAKAMSGASRKQSAVKGKVPYMSPEQLRAEPLDGRADLFSLGVVLFEALGGERPYEGPHDPATIMLILKGEHPPLADLAPDAPPGLCKVIESLIAPDPADRPASAADLIDALDEYAPSPRVRRDFGRLVKDLAMQKDEERAQRTPSQRSNRTELLPDSDEGGTPSSPWAHSGEPGSGVERSGSVSDLPQSSPPGFGEPAISSQPAPPSTESGAPSRPPAEPVGPVRPPRDASTPFGLSRPEADLDTLNTLREEREKKREFEVDRKHSRRLWLGLLAGVAAVGLATFTAVMFWPSDVEDETGEAVGQTEEPSRETPTEEVQPAPDESPSPRPEPDQTKEGVAAEAPPSAKETDTTRGNEAEGTKEPQAMDEPSRTRPQEPTRSAQGQKQARKKAPPPEPEPKAKQPARLTITVFPWGNIWINGQPWGPAPLKGESMRPGTYKISAGQRAPTKTQTVKLRAGQRKTVEFNLGQ